MKRIKSNFPVYISYNFTKGFGIVVNINITQVRLKVQCLVSIPSHSGKSCGTCFMRPGIVFHRLSTPSSAIVSLDETLILII